jgi:hypothetical protein
MPWLRGRAFRSVGIHRCFRNKGILPLEFGACPPGVSQGRDALAPWKNLPLRWDPPPPSEQGHPALGIRLRARPVFPRAGMPWLRGRTFRSVRIHRPPSEQGHPALGIRRVPARCFPGQGCPGSVEEPSAPLGSTGAFGTRASCPWNSPRARPVFPRAGMPWLRGRAFRSVGIHRRHRNKGILPLEFGACPPGVSQGRDALAPWKNLPLRWDPPPPSEQGHPALGIRLRARPVFPRAGMPWLRGRAFRSVGIHRRHRNKGILPLEFGCVPARCFPGQGCPGSVAEPSAPLGSTAAIGTRASCPWNSAACPPGVSQGRDALAPWQSLPLRWDPPPPSEQGHPALGIRLRARPVFPRAGMPWLRGRAFRSVGIHRRLRNKGILPLEFGCVPARCFPGQGCPGSVAEPSAPFGSTGRHRNKGILPLEFSACPPGVSQGRDALAPWQSLPLRWDPPPPSEQGHPALGIRLRARPVFPRAGMPWLRRRTFRSVGIRRRHRNKGILPLEFGCVPARCFPGQG